MAEAIIAPVGDLFRFAVILLAAMIWGMGLTILARWVRGREAGTALYVLGVSVSHMLLVAFIAAGAGSAIGRDRVFWTLWVFPIPLVISVWSLTRLYRKQRLRRLGRG